MSNLARKLEEGVAKHLGLTLLPDDPVWCTARNILITGGWRGGKSTRAAFRVLRQILRPTKNGLIWLVGPDYPQAREEFRYLLEWCNKLHLYVRHTFPSEGQCTLTTKTGWVILTKSGRYPERLGSVAPDGVVMCEPGQVSPEVYEMIVGRVAEKRGWIFLAGTLEDDSSHPTWAWYEDLANQWLNNPEGSDDRAFSIPSWVNTVVYPGGERDPEIQRQREILSDYTFARKIAAIPVGVRDPCFPELWDDNAAQKYMPSLRGQRGIRFIDGAIGVDYGTTDTHPSAVVAIQQDGYNRFWVRELWMEKGGNPDEIAMVVEAMRKRYEISKIRTDPQQAVLAVKLGGVTALGSGPAPTESRIGTCRGLIEDGFFYFDASGPHTKDVFSSMRRMRRRRDKRGRLVYQRDIGDDAAQAALYAVEELRGDPRWIPNLELGGVKQSWVQLPSRASMVGRV
jgi:hypothetical protein